MRPYRAKPVARSWQLVARFLLRPQGAPGRSPADARSRIKEACARFHARNALCEMLSVITQKQCCCSSGSNENGPELGLLVKYHTLELTLLTIAKHLALKLFSLHLSISELFRTSSFPFRNSVSVSYEWDSFSFISFLLQLRPFDKTYMSDIIIVYSNPIHGLLLRKPR